MIKLQVRLVEVSRNLSLISNSPSVFSVCSTLSKRSRERRSCKTVEGFRETKEKVSPKETPRVFYGYILRDRFDDNFTTGSGRSGIRFRGENPGADLRSSGSESVIAKCNGRLLPDSCVRLEIAVHQLDLSRGNQPRTKWNVKLTFRRTLYAHCLGKFLCRDWKPFLIANGAMWLHVLLFFFLSQFGAFLQHYYVHFRARARAVNIGLLSNIANTEAYLDNFVTSFSRRFLRNFSFLLFLPDLSLGQIAVVARKGSRS